METSELKYTRQCFELFSPFVTLASIITVDYTHGGTHHQDQLYAHRPSYLSCAVRRHPTRIPLLCREYPTPSNNCPEIFLALVW